MPPVPLPTVREGDIVASVGVATIVWLVYRFLSTSPRYPSASLQPPSKTPAKTPSTASSTSIPPSTDSVPEQRSVPVSSTSAPSAPSSTESPTAAPAPSGSTSSGANVNRRYNFFPSAPLRGGLGKTALFIAAARAMESSLPTSTPPLFSDPFAASLAGEYGSSMLHAIADVLDLPVHQLASSVAIRTRYFDDELLKAVTTPLSRIERYVSPSKIREGKETTLANAITSDVISQVVILGVGSDTRSLRLALPEYVTVWEVDSEEVLAFREATISAGIERLGGEATLPSKAHVVPVALDVSAGPPSALGGALGGAGFVAGRPAVWVCEGVLMFLKEPAVKRLLGAVTGFSAAGSVLLCDLLNAQFLRHESQRRLLQAWGQWGVRPCSGTDLPEALFAQLGWGAQVLQEGQEWEVDFGRVSEERKQFYLKEHLRGSTNDWPRTWIVNARKS